MLYQLKCNNIKCFTPLRDSILYTSCGHVYCPSCSNKIHRIKKCIACNHALINPTEYSVRDLRHTSDLLIMPPENVLDEARRSICFWMYQVYEELEMKKRQMESMYTNYKLQCEQLKNELSKIVIEVDIREKRIQTLEREVEREKTNYFDMEERYGEKVKELKKVVAMNEKLKFDLRNSNNGSG